MTVSVLWPFRAMPCWSAGCDCGISWSYSLTYCALFIYYSNSYINNERHVFSNSLFSSLSQSPIDRCWFLFSIISLFTCGSGFEKKMSGTFLYDYHFVVD